MRIFPYYVVPEDELDSIFIEDEIKFLIKTCIKDQRKYKNFNEFETIIKNKYDLWKRGIYEKRRIQ